MTKIYLQVEIWAIFRVEMYGSNQIFSLLRLPFYIADNETDWINYFTSF